MRHEHHGGTASHLAGSHAVEALGPSTTERLMPVANLLANGTPELVLVSGYSGIGKSSVVNELHVPISALRRGIAQPHLVGPSRFSLKLQCLGGDPW
jgi:putative ribosome biogenesis GTPase RsgA